ncbi:phosphohistidine phosphatase SixA [Corynebacterium suranareeae]|uniref:Phosphohistidine phosphatase SixA n=1 Tax=Corynebacterium suranareeae TaxID=2506452 RepID=A0A160PNP3_9CORY|nr:histidine phosphatase family protein [Corynebacterium suranareeae]BAU94463.1 phosphohistidine phosphatase SixA [Corynebacterium suranareeae]
MSSAHRLVILRHAKSSWSTGEPDHKRPLNDRGLRDGVAAGQWLAAHIGEIDHVLCSDVTRTQLTWERVQLGGATTKGASFHNDIYENRVSEFEHLITGLPDEVGTALLIGHWPGVEELAHYFGIRDEHPGWAQMEEKFPTSAIAVLEFNTPWSKLVRNSARLTDFVIPRG